MLRMLVVWLVFSVLIGCGTSGPPRFPETDEVASQWAEQLLGGPPEVGVVVRLDRIRQSSLLAGVIAAAEQQLGEQLGEAGDVSAVDVASSAVEVQLYARRSGGAAPVSGSSEHRQLGSKSKDEWDEAYFVAAITGAPSERSESVLRDGGWKRQSVFGAPIATYQRDGSDLLLFGYSNSTWVIANVPPSAEPHAFSSPPRSELKPAALLVAYGQGSWVVEACKACAKGDVDKTDALFGALVHLNNAESDEVDLGLELLYGNSAAAEKVEADAEGSLSESALQALGLGRFAPLVAAVLERMVTVSRDENVVAVDVAIPSGAIALMLTGSALDLW